MKSVFIELAKFILAVLVISVLSYCLVGLDYLVEYVKNNFNKLNNVSTFDSFESFKENFITISIISAILYFMDNIKISYNKQSKGIYKLLSKWRKERNVANSDVKLYTSNVIEELLEIYYEDKDVIKSYQSSIMKTYFYPVEINKNNTIDAICDIQVFSINETANMGYNPKETMLETIKEINSREQDPKQKEEWAKNGANGKWQKDVLQDKNTLYVADYSKCKL